VVESEAPAANSTSNNPAELTVHAGGPPPTKLQLAGEVIAVVSSIPLFISAPLLRPWHRRWGATDAEVAAAMPGDDLVPGCQYAVTRAISIDAPPRAVWPWLVQVGFGKAGFYANDLLDNAGHPSADRIVDAWQEIHVGDWVPMYTKVNDRTAFKVAAVEPAESLLWVKPDSTWAWRLAASGAGTRLVTRLRILYRWSMPGDALLSLFLNEFGDFPMMRRMLKNMKKRAEQSV
jgi:hypothetical protein